MGTLSINRRQAMTIFGGIAAAAALPFSVVKAQEKKILVTCVESDPPTLNSAVSTNIQTLMTCTPVYNWLVKTRADGSIQPDLAETWSVSEDGKVFTFKFRSGVKWHDGTPFTAADAKFTVDEMLSKLQPIGKNAYANVQSVETPDDLTLVITFSAPNNPFLSVPFALGPVLPRHLWEGTNFTTNQYDKTPVGTGPFKLVENRIGDAIEYEANADYFGGKPAFDGLIFRIIPDQVSRSAAFENGELDAIVGNSVPFTDIPAIAARSNVTMKSTAIPGGAFIGIINMKSEPYGDVRVRQALAHAIDRAFIRENIVKAVSHQMVGPLWPASPLYNSELEDYAFDPAKANALLDEAGLARDASGKRSEFRLMWQNVFPAVQRMGEVISQNLKAVGIETILMQLETSAVVQRGYIEGGFDMIIGSYALGPDPDFGTERLYNSNNIKPLPYTNNSSYVNEEVDRLFAEQRQVTNFEARKQIYDRIQALIWHDVPVLPMCAYDLVGFEDKERVSGCYEAWNVFAEDFSQAKPLGA